MTAPKVIWAYDDGAHIMAFDFETNIGGAVSYIRADAPEIEALVGAGREAQQALVDAAEEIAELRLAMSKTDLELPWIGDAIDQLRAALAAWEAKAEELDFLHHEGGPDSVAALEAEAAALRDEVARLRHQIQEASDPDFIWGAMDNVADMDTTIDDYADAVSRAQRAALTPDPRVEALVKAADRMLDAFCIHDTGEQVASYEATCDALAAFKGNSHG